MKKKNILIAILCVTILLLVPLTNVSGASVGGLNTKDEVIENDYVLEDVDESNLDKVISLLNDLKVHIDEVLLKFGYIPEVEEECQKLLNAIDIDVKSDFRPICILLENIKDSLLNYMMVIIAISTYNEFVFIVLFPLIMTLFFILACLNILYYSVFLCEESPSPQQDILKDMLKNQLPKVVV